MKHVGMLAMLMLLCPFATSNLEGRQQQALSKVESGIIKGKVFRSDTNTAISNAYILLMQEKDSPAPAEYFDLRSDEHGNYCFTNIPAGKYKVTVYAWFPKMNDVPCRNPFEAKTGDNEATVEWQRKSRAFMEIVTIRDFAVSAGQEKVKDVDLLCK